MNYYKLALVITSILICNQILESKFFQIYDHHYSRVTCTPLHNAYEYNNIVIDYPNISPNSPHITCYFTCYYFEKCHLTLKKPYTYGYMARIVIAIITLINCLVIFEFK